MGAGVTGRHLLRTGCSGQCRTKTCAGAATKQTAGMANAACAPAWVTSFKRSAADLRRGGCIAATQSLPLLREMWEDSAR